MSVTLAVIRSTTSHTTEQLDRVPQDTSDLFLFADNLQFFSSYR